MGRQGRNGVSAAQLLTRMSATAVCVVAAAIGGGTWQHPVTKAQGQTYSQPGVVLISAAVHDVIGAGFQLDVNAASGIVLTADGEILTANHVINGATGVTVTDPATGRSYRGTVVGYSIVEDLALIQLAGASDLTPAPLGDSHKLIPGMAVTGVGNANAGGHLAAAQGSVLETNQTLNVGPTYMSQSMAGLIIDSAPIVDGDSGGPLLDAAGKVVGVDDSTDEGATPPVSAAIPIDEALSVVDRIQAGKTDATVHAGPTASLGYLFNPYYGDETPPGCSDQPGSGLTIPGDCVMAAEPGSPAAAIGLGTDFDVITALDGRTVTSHKDAVAILAGLVPGQSVTVDWTSQDNRRHRSVTTLVSGLPY